MSKVLLILVDGMRPDGLEEIPEAKKLMERCAYTMEAQTVYPSVTLACHMSLFLSVEPGRHGTMENTHVHPARPIQGLCEVLHQEKKRCAFFYNWEQLRDLSRPGKLEYSYYASGGHHGFETANKMVTDAAIAHIPEYQPDFAFVYLGWADEAGHGHGWMSEEYHRALRSSWKDIDRLIAAVPEEYSVIITADHGGHDRTHGTEMPEDMTIPVFLCRTPLAAGKIEAPASIMDLAPTITSLLGVEPDGEWVGKSLV